MQGNSVEPFGRKPMTKADMEKEELALLTTHNWQNWGMAPLGRTMDQIDKDYRFLTAYTDAVRSIATPPQLAKSFTFHKGGQLQLWTGDQFKSLNLPRGLYDRDVIKVALAEEKVPLPSEYLGLLYSLYQEIPTANTGMQSIMLTEDGQYISIENAPGWEDNVIPLWYGGLVYKIVNGQLVLQRSLTTAEFNQHYPKIAAHGLPGGYYHSALLAKETSAMWDLAPAVLEDFRSRLKLYSVAEILAVAPVWIRTWGMSGDGNGAS